MNIHSVDCKTLQSWLQNKQAVLVDVRETAENKVVRIQEAELIPLGEINLSLLPEFDDKKLVLHCKSGKRSFAACQRLLAQNPSLEIYNLEGGIESWIANGFEVKTN
jgi:rhodanese-related sulfurtransferase